MRHALKRPPSLIAAALAAAAVASAPEARAVTPTGEEARATPICAAFDANPSAESARDCALAQERALGPDAPELLEVYQRIAAGFAGDEDTAELALPYRRRAHRLAERAFGRESGPAADAALSYARTWILSGHCTAQDPRVQPLLDAAAVGYAALEPDDDRRGPGLRAVASAYADALRFEDAAETLASVAASGRELVRIGGYRLSAGDEDGAIATYEAALQETRAPLDARGRSRLMDRLRRLLFARGEIDRLRALEEAARP